ncbi:hypothetical protein [Streptacidiphilus anmyonensis]|uniref:hypothetical protein n=1 Tax=Streptacidiphilus anmyonensis TaxID=405782 RepID=UPI0005AA7DEF|nr:hypothetical protein [Streptacidiphilus anmyonensis]
MVAAAVHGVATLVPDFAARFPLGAALPGGDGRGSAARVDPEAGCLGRAARSRLMRAVDLLLAGATGAP